MKYLLFILIVFVSGCSNSPVENGAPETPDSNQGSLSKKQALACLEMGGQLKDSCMRSQPYCIVNYPDAGKECDDSTQCHGSCRIENQFLKAGLKTNGYCSANNKPCGCFQLIEKGIAQPALCRD